MLPADARTKVPLLPVFAPLMLVGACFCLPTAPLTLLSRGNFGFPSIVMTLGGLPISLLMVVGLALVRRDHRLAKHVCGLACALALCFAGWIVLDHHALQQGALAGADAESRATMMEHGSASRPWVYLSALLAPMPTLLGGAIGARWLATAKARLRSTSA